METSGTPGAVEAGSIPVGPPPRFAGIDEQSIGILVDVFYLRARHDPVLGPVFIRALGDDDAVWTAHLARVRAFWSSVLLASGRYLGRPMQVHAELPGVGAAHFRQWLDLFVATAEELFEPGPAAQFAARAARMAAALQQGIVVAKGTLPP
ncbi:group III truncated hemoglobin [Rhodocista pekingensis]|uniref:Group III truncated hemoglobin n=1 Tax=Rhodocista pekingensis TaxID=201185 RepID=A0ABW2KWG2_9PROT